MRGLSKSYFLATAQKASVSFGKTWAGQWS